MAGEPVEETLKLTTLVDANRVSVDLAVKAAVAAPDLLLSSMPDGALRI